MTGTATVGGAIRSRATKADMVQRQLHLCGIVKAMRPMTVRQVFYQATEIVEAVIQEHLPRRQFKILKIAEESEREISSPDWRWRK